jgi:hypothetical protein
MKFMKIGLASRVLHGRYGLFKGEQLCQRALYLGNNPLGFQALKVYTARR